MSNPPIITIELTSPPNQPPWWQATFNDHHGAGPDPAAALDNLFQCIITSVLTKPATAPETPKAATAAPVRLMQARLSS
jgi:hypothetical protein